MASIHLHISEIRIFWFSTEFWKIVDELVVQFPPVELSFHRIMEKLLSINSSVESGIRNPVLRILGIFGIFQFPSKCKLMGWEVQFPQIV